MRRPVEYSEDNLTRNKIKDEDFHQSLSSVARNAVDIVEAIRTDEINSYWRHAGLVGQEDDERFAGEMFSKAKPFILGSELWKVIQRMPKGSLLHTHWNSMLSYDTILKILQKTEGIAVSSSQSLYLDLYRKNATLSISHANYTLNESVPSLHSETYIAGTKVSLLRAAKEWPGGNDAFFDYLKTKVELTKDISLHHDLGVDAVWRQFSKYFATGGTMLLYEPVFREFVQVLLEDLANDGIDWVEIRSDTSIANLVPEGMSSPSSDSNFPWKVLSEEVDKFKASELGKNFWGLRVIWSDKRAKNTSQIIEGM